MFENVGFKVLPFVIVADGPEILVQTVLEIVLSESVAEVPVGADVLVGSCIDLSGPAFADGGAFAAAETTTCISLVADAPSSSVAVNLKT
ncbi:MAG: hypothetical protein A3D92_23385 [Bacteroidetes bacterium RIFCSPHIGHO2_02_FULL_44_7]|nr:MAG: hypothetical protein A3D92_23385 [Bacteroidetes bacterium RIFCSPHIGHO2_02_FULL_44_7]